MRNIRKGIRRHATAGLLGLGSIMTLNGPAIAAAPLDCSLDENWKEFHVSTAPARDDLRPLPTIGAPGGSGSFQGLLAQQSGPAGNTVIQISSDATLSTTGIEAELIAVNFDLGLASFSACTRQGFLILAPYYNEAGSVAGAPAAVLGAGHPVNFANMTDRSYERIGVRFNDGGADGTLSIIQNKLAEYNSEIVLSDRVVAENILVNNITNVFDFSESQAPVFAFDQNDCFVEDRFVLFTKGTSCVGFANPAVSDVLKSSGESVMDPTNGSVLIELGDIYTAIIGNAAQTRRVLFASALDKNNIGEEPDREPGSTFRDCDECPTMVVIPDGVFLQGSPEDESIYRRERPQREVTVSTFAMGQTEVTFEQWEVCVAEGGCDHIPDYKGWGRGDRPLIYVTMGQAQEYVSWLSEKTDQVYRLPSESEWEYATRAGTTGRYNTGVCITTDQANFSSNSAQGCPQGIWREKTLPVANFLPNAFGLYDTHGNVEEFVLDCANDTYDGAPTDGSAWLSGDCSVNIARGGSWESHGINVRSANRQFFVQDGIWSFVGFRVARSSETTTP